MWTKRRMYAAAAASNSALARRSQWPQCKTVALNVGIVNCLQGKFCIIISFSLGVINRQKTKVRSIKEKLEIHLLRKLIFSQIVYIHAKQTKCSLHNFFKMKSFQAIQMRREENSDGIFTFRFFFFGMVLKILSHI